MTNHQCVTSYVKDNDFIGIDLPENPLELQSLNLSLCLRGVCVLSACCQRALRRGPLQARPSRGSHERVQQGPGDRHQQRGGPGRTRSPVSTLSHWGGGGGGGGGAGGAWSSVITTPPHPPSQAGWMRRRPPDRFHRGKQQRLLLLPATPTKEA